MPVHHNFEVLDSKTSLDDPNQNRVIGCLKSNKLTLATVAGVILGGLLGALLKTFISEEFWTERNVMYISFPGDLFLQMLKGLILPLIVSSLISAIASLDLSLSGKIATRAISYYLTTTFASVVLGIALVLIIKPGEGYAAEELEEKEPRKVLTVDTLLDLVRATVKVEKFTQ